MVELARFGPANSGILFLSHLHCHSSNLFRRDGERAETKDGNVTFASCDLSITSAMISKLHFENH